MRDETSPSCQFGPFRLEVREHRLLRDGVPVPLTPKVFTVLCVLVEHGGHLVEKEALLKSAWPDSYVEEGALNRSVSVLRKALGDDGETTKYIETVPKRGYRFVAPVTECRDHAERPRAEDPPPRARHHLRLGRYAAAGALAAGVLVTTGWFRFSDAGGRGPDTPASLPVHTQVTFTGTASSPTLSPDGRRIAYVSADASQKRLIVQEVAGGQPLEVFGAPELGYLRWSPDGSELLMWARGGGWDGVYVIPQMGGTPRRIAARRFIACWSPGGSAVAVASYNTGRLWLFDGRGREDRTIDLDGVHWSIWDIDWSAANNRILFVSSDYQARYTIWTIRPDGSDQTKIVMEDTEIRSVRWAPAGDAIYYFRRDDQTVSLRKLAVPSAGLARDAGTTLVSGLEADGSLALDGRATRVVYARAPYYSNLWRLDADTGRTTELTRGTSLVERPRVSPDGASVVFNVGHARRASLYTVPIAGGTPRRLTFLDSLNVGGAWSPDGARVAFASTEGGTPRVWTMDAAGGTPQPLSSRDLSDTLDLTWAPGERILYQQAGNRNYYEVDSETGTERLLVDDASRGWLFAPVVSPDGRQIAVQWNRAPVRGLWVIDTSNRRETPVYGSAAGSIKPIGWSADGRWIFAVEGKNCSLRGQTSSLGETMTEAAILRIALRGGRVDTVAHLPGGEIGSVSVTPDGRRFVYPVFSSRSDVWVIDNLGR
jgi:Tol biopolymer transport system component/DNA-binding winged helix-turn-helix (wHTH) protein